MCTGTVAVDPIMWSGTISVYLGTGTVSVFPGYMCKGTVPMYPGMCTSTVSVYPGICRGTLSVYIQVWYVYCVWVMYCNSVSRYVFLGMCTVITLPVYPATCTVTVSIYPGMCTVTVSRISRYVYS